MNENAALDILEKYGHSDDYSNSTESDAYKFSWFKYVAYLSQENKKLYDFVAALSLSAAIKDALFYTDIANTDYNGLHVYLDAPMIFALLGFDTPERQSAYEALVRQMYKVGCSIHVFFHNYQEFTGILENGAIKAISSDYDMSKASKAARFFHDSQMSEQEITEFIGDTEAKLNNMHVTISQTKYDMLEDRFQEDEGVLFDMIKHGYVENSRLFQREIEESIRIDVRSIIMIYRARGAITSNTIPACGHILLTTNNLIANVSKKYESNKSVNFGHIPACISADFFGAVLWLNSPAKMLNYKRKQLLADCYLFQQPTRKMISDYVRTIEKARDSGELDDKKFLFLRAHPMVRDALMNILKGDYARFSSDTWKEVYEKIQEKAEKKFFDEEAAHNQTSEQLEDSKVKIISLQNENSRLEERIQSLEDEQKKEKEAQLDKKCSMLGLLFSCLIFGVPYIIILTLIELIKTQFTVFSWLSFWGTAGLLIIPLILSVIFTKCRKWCSNKVREHYVKK